MGLAFLGAPWTLKAFLISYKTLVASNRGEAAIKTTSQQYAGP